MQQAATKGKEPRRRGRGKGDGGNVTRNGAPPNLVATTSELEALCARLADEEFITVDTEFMRERTFWPRLCLVQVAGAREAAIIDPLAEEIDLAPFFDLLADERVLKVFHAGKQDIEIFHRLAGRVPAPVFDTQIAAMVCGFGDQASYESLVNRLAGAQIDKSSRFTDWARRPLSARQLQYALSDVTHLRVITEKLRACLRERGREEWLAEELAALVDPRAYEMAPEDAWERLKGRPRNPRQLALFQELAAWRESEAQRRDIPRRRVLKDEAIAEIATEMPLSAQALGRLRSVSEGVARSSSGRAILEIVRRVRDLPESELPLPRARPRPPPEGTQGRADILKLALKIVAEREGIAPRIIASAKEVEQLAAGERDLPMLRGWRRRVFGDLALELLRGERVIGLSDGRPCVMPASDTGSITTPRDDT